jgi:hypothetical protein
MDMGSRLDRITGALANGTVLYKASGGNWMAIQETAHNYRSHGR